MNTAVGCTVEDNEASIVGAQDAAETTLVVSVGTGPAVDASFNDACVDVVIQANLAKATTIVAEAPSDARAVGVPAGASSAGPGWILLGISSHLVWGLYPVVTRYIQVSLDLPGILFLSCTNLLALVLLQLTTRAGFGERSALTAGAAYALLVCGRSSSNFLSANYTIALYIGLITALAPFIVALFSWLALRESMPHCLGPALISSALGSFLTIGGQSDWSRAKLSDDDTFGIAMAFASILVSATMRVYMKTTSSSLSGLMLVSWQHTTGFLLLIPGLYSLSSSDLDRLQAMSAYDVTVCLLFTLVMNLFAMLSQVYAVRHLGPTFDGSLQPLRLVTTLAGGHFVLGETVHSATAWGGLALILCTLAAYVSVQPQPSATLPKDTKAVKANRSTYTVISTNPELKGVRAGQPM